MITVGGGAIATPALSRAIREFGEQAKKQLDETGSLAGFEGKFTDDSSGGGSVTVTISALGTAAYDASAGKDDTFLAYTLSAADPDGSSGGGGTGSSLTIRNAQEIDAFIAGFQGAANSLNFTSYLYGTPEELAAVNGSPAATDAAPAASGSTTANAAQSQVFAKLQEQQTASNQLIDLLQSFLDGLGRSKRDSSRDAASAGQSQEIQARLAHFAGTDITT